MLYAYTRPRYQMSIYMTIGPLVLVLLFFFFVICFSISREYCALLNKIAYIKFEIQGHREWTCNLGDSDL